jgi:hypothetical protein
MYTKECKWCNKIIEVEKQCLYAIHVANCSCNSNRELNNKKASEKLKGIEKVKRIAVEQTCPKCGIKFVERVTENLYNKGKYKKFCSRKCANSQTWSVDHKQKLSNTCKNSEKVLGANKNRLHTVTALNRHRGAGKNNKSFYEFTCLACGEIGKTYGYNKHQKYHKECWQKMSGGVKRGSSRGKCGWYKGYWCDSSYELAFLYYCLENDDKIERNYKGYEYFYKNKKHLYYPDFRVNNELVEIKNYESDLTNAKIKSVDEKITVYYKQTMKSYLEYIIGKHGKNFIVLYDKKIPS